MYSLPLVTLFIALYTACISVHLSLARCTHPSVRKEWRSMTKAQRANWISAVKCLATLPHDDALAPYAKPTDIGPVNASGSYYDDLVYIHMDMNHLIHFTGLFLPWHRWYVHANEVALKSKCGFTGAAPYWNWAEDAADVQAFFARESDPRIGLGGFGDMTKDFSVPDGGFSTSSSFKLTYPAYHNLRRNFTLKPYVGFPLPGFEFDPNLDANATFTQAEVNKMVNGFVGNFTAFQTYLEAFQGAHGGVHFILGGDLAGMCPESAGPTCFQSQAWSSNDPVFWLHHGMIDKVWYDWQNQHKANAKAFAGGSVEAITNATEFERYPTGGPPFLHKNSAIPGLGIFDDITVGDVMSTTDGILCYIYE